jgi:hypothetical protein
MRLFSPDSRKRLKKFWKLLIVTTLLVAFGMSPWGSLTGLDSHPRMVKAGTKGGDKSDLNNDGNVDEGDLTLFSQQKLGLQDWTDWSNEQWCQWYAAEADKNNKYSHLLDFIYIFFECDSGGPPPSPSLPPAVHSNDYPVRMALGPGQNLYVSDANVHSVFSYDAGLNITGELTGLDGPLAVAVDASGNIYVGNRGSYNVEMYDPSGNFLRSLGDGKIKMPNDMAFDQQGNLYIVDSESKKVWVYASNGTLLRTIGSAGLGDGRFKFPRSLIIQDRTNSSGQQVQELYVGDQGEGKIQVFDLQGNFLRAFGGKPTSGMMGYKVKGKFAMLQSLQMDAYGRLHVLDSQFSNIQILNPDTGAYITVYGTRGTDPGQLRLPLDMVIDGSAQVVVANYGNKRLEMLSMP